ncbi:MAG: 50S ribosomal protein L3 [Candidatus Aenigmarchaeota archaeon ex4484_14]|nr:MAG: 50S ribosomal protein L3 [Candidatus Aenigmarchaeota archaeon ex4484_14]
MPKHSKPRAGSKAYWPRKRARRIYPDIHVPEFFAKTKEVVPLAFAGWKVGMTHVIMTDHSNSPTKGLTIQKPVTVIESPSLSVCALRFYQKTSDGLISIGEIWSPSKDSKKLLERKLGKHDVKKNFDIDSNIDKISDVRLIVHTQPNKAGIGKKKPELFELPIGGTDVKKKIEYAKSVLGKEISAKDVFQPGEAVDVSGVTTGRGFTGPVKRFGIKIQGRKDEQHHRHAGTKGQERPGKMRWQVPMPGQYGFFRRTELNKRILVIDNDPTKVIPKGGFLNYGVVKGDYIIIEGSVVGPTKRLVMIRKAIRSSGKPRPVEIKYISQESKQGV